MARYIAKQKSKERNIEWFLAIASSGSVAAWWIFDVLPLLWALIVVVGQIFTLSKKYILTPYAFEKLQALQTFLDTKYHEYDLLWLDLSLGRLTSDELCDKYLELEERFFEESKEFVDINIQNNELALEVDTVWQKFLKRKYNPT
ncbi:MAG: hypothetical protein ABJH05_07600 [Fulvivirga sp.]